MSEKEWIDLLNQFRALGGIAENICQRNGERGRGIYSKDPTLKSKIFTPRSLLFSYKNYQLCNEDIIISDSSSLHNQEKDFLLSYYNLYSWGGGGNSDSIAFLRDICSMPESVKTLLLRHKFIDDKMLLGDSLDNIFHRFVSERVVDFDGGTVLAPIWEFVNHSNFALPIRITKTGVETPPRAASNEEIVFKYSSRNSPISMWAKYGFACDCILAYSIPIAMTLNKGAIQFKCRGAYKMLQEKHKNIYLIDGEVIVNALPVGCLSKKLPSVFFDSILAPLDIPAYLARDAFDEIQDVNLQVRRQILNNLGISHFGRKSELYKSLSLEIELIQDSRRR